MAFPVTFVSSFLAALALLPLVTHAADNGTTPMQIRLAYAGAVGMVVSWNTFSQLSQPTVKYGTSASELNLTASSNDSVSYPTSTTHNNHVRLTGLNPNTLYYYQPEGGESSTFKTSRAAGDGMPYSIAVVVDLGLIGPEGLTTHVGTGSKNPLGPNDQNTVQSILKDGADEAFLWHR